MKTARRMTVLLPKMTGGTWKYPQTKTVLVAAGLHLIVHYVQVRRAHIMWWVINTTKFRSIDSIYMVPVSFYIDL